MDDRAKWLMDYFEEYLKKDFEPISAFNLATKKYGEIYNVSRPLPSDPDYKTS